MVITELQNFIEEHIKEHSSHIISNDNNLSLHQFKKQFNKSIRQNFKDAPGVYAWENTDTTEIIYIGMAGKISNNGEIKQHGISKRLTASRGKNKNSKDVTTNEFIFHLLTNPLEMGISKFNHILTPINKIKIHAFYVNPSTPSTYIESILLYNYYKNHNQLPLLNLSF